ncbi:hypothetical protein CUT44_31910 [Streptomyces carminius]|uniref:Resolvase/invertase-type recombinase catalytic domain-containing protein n=1 Tax=Streptomyces carminius TaxID=2665496 RepID=A0A2M8LPG0_9ACTN|nr:recombinase family protein [Streptomyces carminius]PJE93812.1 hypothetical protein CUT44_31910 [Streptomyces carminius]
MKPLIYGYMRIEPHQEDDTIKHLEESLHGFADRGGYELAKVFQEEVSGSHIAFDELLLELLNHRARQVVVPNLSHLSVSPLLRAIMLSQLSRRTGAHLHEAGAP